MDLYQAKLKDLKRLMPLITQFYSYFKYPYDIIKHQEIVKNFLKNKHFGSIWLVEYEHEIVGYLALTYGFTFEFGGKDAFIDEFFIAEKYRNLGLGKKALTIMQSKLIDLGLNAFHLQVEHYNPDAKKLYLNMGFRDLNRDTLTWQAKQY